MHPGIVFGGGVAGTVTVANPTTLTVTVNGQSTTTSESFTALVMGLVG